MLTRFQGDFERVCSILSTFSTSVSGGSRNEVPRLIASLVRQSLRRCKSAAVPCSHLFLALTYGPCSRLSCQDGKKQWNKSRCNCFSQKKNNKNLQGKQAHLASIDLGLIVLFSLKESRVMMQRQKDRNAIKQASKGGWVCHLTAFFSYMHLPHHSEHNGLGENLREWLHELPSKEPGLILIITLWCFSPVGHSIDFHCSDTTVKQA